MQKLAEACDAGKAIRGLDLDEAERAVVSGFSFLSQKPLLLIVNRAEENVSEPLSPAIQEAARSRGLEVMAMSAPIASAAASAMFATCSEWL